MFLNIFNFFSRFSKLFSNIFKISCEFLENFLLFRKIILNLTKIFSIAFSLPSPPTAESLATALSVVNAKALSIMRYQDDINTEHKMK